jgi:hypothetical protein
MNSRVKTADQLGARGVEHTDNVLVHRRSHLPVTTWKFVAPCWIIGRKSGHNCKSWSFSGTTLSTFLLLLVADVVCKV